MYREGKFRSCSLLLLILAILLLPNFLPAKYIAAQAPHGLRIGIDAGHANYHTTGSELQNLTTTFTQNSITTSLVTGLINLTFLNSIDILLIPPPLTNYTASEVDLLRNWYLAGGRLLLTASPENGTAVAALNAVLKGLGSTIAFEQGYLTDPLFNLNSTAVDSEDVILPIMNHANGLLNGLTTDLRVLYSFRPVPVIGYRGNSYVKFNSTLQPTDTWIAESSGTAKIHALPSGSMQTYKVNETGQAPVVAVESSTRGRLGLVGFPLLSSWKGSLLYSRWRPYDNRLLLRNLIQWLGRFSLSSELEATLPVTTARGQPLVLIDTTERNAYSSQTELTPLMSLLTGMGFTVNTFSIGYDINVIKNASVIIIQEPNQVITSNDTDVLKLWLQEGGKLLILASQGDYSTLGSALQAVALNQALSAINSTLRFEQGSISDSELSVPGNPYLTISSNINHVSPALVNITHDVRSLYLSLSTIIAGWNGTDFIPLESNLAAFPSVTWISKTSNSTATYNLKPLPSPQLQTHTSGQRGSYITAALEKYTPTGALVSPDRLLLVGGPLFAGFSRMLDYPTVYGYPTDNLLFVRNIFTTLLNQPQTKTELTSSASPTEISEGKSITISIHYSSLQMSASNLTNVERVAVNPAKIALTFGGSALNTTILANGTFVTTTIPSGTGHVSWSVSASEVGYQSQTSTGSVVVNPLQGRFTLYVLGIPVVIFIAVTVAVITRKTR